MQKTDNKTSKEEIEKARKEREKILKEQQIVKK